jgi:hypothetical protein
VIASQSVDYKCQQEYIFNKSREHFVAENKGETGGEISRLTPEAGIEWEVVIS